MTASGKWQPGALRQALTEVLGGSHRGARADELAARTGWSVSSVRRELALMEQLGLIRAGYPVRAAQWRLTIGGEILWLLSKGEQRTPVLATMLGQPEVSISAEAIRLAHLGLVRGRSGQSWRLAGKAAR